MDISGRENVDDLDPWIWAGGDVVLGPCTCFHFVVGNLAYSSINYTLEILSDFKVDGLN